ncbi:DNA-3-methyladenine glycosylase [Alkalicoccobacillus porphyridii]|uniref:Putative 3-methyladenine DNA glycosylase n=1 Tax=Alkalicoccobacillus porphyridii TaxID=2597270 RepID=A0A554A056_9BACI|nr:DNA-3-methyladenine glycosylase [Alkalicoccobacillus porphyridii]TSB47078.1 DNA-3-methyladenine glycosylase [Alkalicoccobacillus porphyridii]
MNDILPTDFYHQPTLELAKSLLGTYLVHESKEGTVIGRIVETEAYLGIEDAAAHSYLGRRTKRTEVMFGSAGTVYTYVMHTHCLFNIVANERDIPEAVLVRAVEPIEGHELMRSRRGEKGKGRQVSNGPGKLTKALGITMDFYGWDITKPPLYITKGETPEAIEEGVRIGIDNTGEARYYPYRFWIKDNPYVSR